MERDEKRIVVKSLYDDLKMAMSEPLSGLSLISPPPPPQLATSASSSTDDGVDMSADDEADIIKNFGATSRYAGKLSSCVPKLAKKLVIH